MLFSIPVTGQGHVQLFLLQQLRGKNLGMRWLVGNQKNYETRNKIRQIKSNITILTCPTKQDCGVLKFTQMILQTE